MRYVGLLRGVNVGAAKRLAMADLRAALESLGFDRVRTVLQSGNVVFDADAAPDARAIEDAIHATTGVRAPTVVLEGERLRAIAAANPLLDAVVDPSRALVHVLGAAVDAASVALPDARSIAPERIALGEGAVYQWCPDGISSSTVPPRFFTSLGVVVTARNLRTVDKLLALLDEGARP
jgi:uncharacterized protein (DUF1697 family)